MNIDNALDDILKTEPNKKNTEKLALDQNHIPLKELLEMDLTEDIEIEIYNRFRTDIEIYIDDFMSRCKDTHAPDGMYKCSLETWQACTHEIGMNYFTKNKYLRDTKKIAVGGGQAFKDELLRIGIILYEDLCITYRKQFFIYDCCRFLGMNLDTMYQLNNLHSDMLKKVHSMQESSMRTALASGRSNVTAMAILLNHDYNYTKTTEIIHHSSNEQISADKLPELVPDMRKIDDKSMNLIDDMM